MSRNPRVVLPGYLHHVTQRGNNCQYIFFDEDDYILYLKYIEEYRVKYRVNIYAYCLMGDHVHFIVKPLEHSSLAKMFSVVHMRYAQYFKRKNNASGHVWQGRFFSCLLQDVRLKQAIRYVEQNPVRAKMVSSPWKYSWSSARVHLGKEYKWITLADIGDVLRVNNWREFLNETEDTKFLARLRESTKKSFIVGEKEFIISVQDQLGRIIVPKPHGRPRKREGK